MRYTWWTSRQTRNEICNCVPVTRLNTGIIYNSFSDHERLEGKLLRTVLPFLELDKLPWPSSFPGDISHEALQLLHVLTGYDLVSFAAQHQNGSLNRY